MGEHSCLTQRGSAFDPVNLISKMVRGVGVNTPACHAGDRGFKLSGPYWLAAQLVEHLIEAQSAGGLIPSCH